MQQFVITNFTISGKSEKKSWIVERATLLSLFLNELVLLMQIFRLELYSVM